MMPAIRITQMTVKADRVVCLIEVAPDVSRYTSPCMARMLVEKVPSLPLHTCKNSRGATFGDCMDHTSLPHVLEHLVIDYQVQNACEKQAYDTGLFVGTSEWTDEKRGKARLELSFKDDIEALGAIQQAVHLLNDICAACAMATDIQ